MPQWKSFLLALVLIVLLDSMWFSFAIFVAPWIYPEVLFQDVALWPAPIAWSPIALGISVCKPRTWKEAAACGAFVGFICFCCFNGTALTFFPLYRETWWTPVFDTTWGTFSGFGASTITFTILRRVSKEREIASLPKDSLPKDSEIADLP